ncbi:thiamine diphosphokinase [Alkaliphilus sp. MSJ-5]|uniref:Thiamine diphosphokinase n=1 Tax=Alkaliphilus flagellatus TaxID=2841507 RepID=A0ABS6G6X1_9FIRM|nr:thiamine diphosphokinase [Alkaliphilus flagellatus]MBU5677368.1 thiamine diphosphokinase [Alkaliphilus flagellatus]
MKVTVVTNGHIENMNILKSVIENSDYIICADGAAKYLMKLNIYPNILVGDLDSINKDAFQWIENGGVKVQQFPVKKDMTDTELAIEFALEQSPSTITIVGAIGSRMDHSLGNIMLLYKIHKMGIKANIINEINHITITDSTINVAGKIGQTISVIPISGDVKGVTLEGLEYPLTNHDIDMGSSLGISNRFIKDRATISVKEGTVLVIKVCDEV